MLALVNGTGVTPYQVSTQIFSNREITVHEVRFAISETLSHLEYLVNQNQLVRDESPGWVYRYK